MDILPGHDAMDLWGSSRPAASTPPGDGPGRPGHNSCTPRPTQSWPATFLSVDLLDGTQAHVVAVIEHATGRTPGPHPYLEPGLSAGLLSVYETHHNQHRPHRFLRGAAPLKALPEPADLAHYRVRRHARSLG